MQTEKLFNFIQERHAIYMRRTGGCPKPWTNDLILQQYRFCNVYRELDTVTQWIRVNWRKPNDNDPDLWFAMTVARFVNWPESLEKIGYPVPWEPNKFIARMDARKKAKEKTWTGAYIIQAGLTKEKSKAVYIAQEVLTPMWQERKACPRPAAGACSLSKLHAWLFTRKGMGSFMAGQVVADTKFQTSWRENAPDWWTFAVPGPGSQRGLNWVYGRPVNARWAKGEWLTAFTALQAAIDPLAARAGLPRISGQDLQNVLCEIFKYVRGYSRSKYNGTGA